MERWFINMKKADFYGIAEKYDISPIIARIIRNREIISEEEIDFYLNGTIADLYDGMLMKDMDRAVEILAEKIREEKPIRIIGDYDIDGVNATYILQSGLSELGGKVDIDIPDRIKDGYGLNQTLIDRAIDAGIDTIITCDNGIAAYDEIAYGHEKGLTIIVTDHHEVPFEMIDDEKCYMLPPADAVVDIKRPDCEYPFKKLCGAAVAYKMIEALFNMMMRDPEDVDYLMENVAIATIGDVVDLEGENRVFAKQGLEMLKRTKNEGLKALMECTSINVDKLKSYDIAFVLGPCINASGRLDTAKRALSLLNARTPDEAMRLANELKCLNDERKDMTERGKKAAIEMVETTDLINDKVLVIYLPDIHESIAGIIASKVKERFYRPTIIFTKVENGVKGSGRSTDEYDMFEQFNKYRDMFTKFGGHKAAVGASMKEENLEKFRKAINDVCPLTDEQIQEKVLIDMELPFGYVTKDLVEQLKVIEPCGKGNKTPLFVAKDLQVIDYRRLGKNRNGLKCKVKDQTGIEFDAVSWEDVDALEQLIMEKGQLTFTFFPSINNFDGEIQLRIKNFR